VTSLTLEYKKVLALLTKVWPLSGDATDPKVLHEAEKEAQGGHVAGLEKRQTPLQHMRVQPPPCPARGRDVREGGQKGKGGEAEGGEATTKKILDGLPDDADLTNKVLQQALLYLKAIDDNTGKFIQGNEYTPAFSTREMQNIQDLLAKGQGGKLGSLPSIQEIMKVFTETTDGDQAKAQQMTIDAIRSFVNNPDNNYQGKDGMLRLLDSQKGAIKMYNKGTMGFGKLFENFGSGQMAMLHGEEAVIPKNSPIGGMLSMMQGDLGNLKESAFKDGKMNIGGMIESATKMGAKYDSYAKENSNAINDQGRGMVKSMTGMSDEQLDKVSQSSVQSNTSTSSAPAVNSMGGGKLDELIRINKQMLTELRNM